MSLYEDIENNVTMRSAYILTFKTNIDIHGFPGFTYM